MERCSGISSTVSACHTAQAVAAVSDCGSASDRIELVHFDANVATWSGEYDWMIALRLRIQQLRDQFLHLWHHQRRGLYFVAAGLPELGLCCLERLELMMVPSLPGADLIVRKAGPRFWTVANTSQCGAQP